MTILDDFMREYRLHKKEVVIKAGKTHNESEVYCPYCGIVQCDIFDELPKHNTEEIAFECEMCNEKFLVKQRMKYSTRKLEE